MCEIPRSAHTRFEPELAPYIVELFELYGTGNYSLKALQTHFFALADKERNEAVAKAMRRGFGYKTTEYLLGNHFYYGARVKNGKVIQTGKEKHAPLISKELFDRCKKMKAIRAQGFRVRLAEEISKPLMGILKCDVCDHSITGEVHKKPSGKIYVYYHCANQACAERRKNIRQEQIFDNFRIRVLEICS